jgi:hypothetical protein
MGFTMTLSGIDCQWTDASSSALIAHTTCEALRDLPVANLFQLQTRLLAGFLGNKWLEKTKDAMKDLTPALLRDKKISR